MRFHYLPDGAPRSKLNTESAEYANIVASTNRFYDAAVARGMAPLPPEDEALLRRWMTRVLAGYWTHAGYLNWDTGFGFGRWHQMKKFGARPAVADRDRRRRPAVAVAQRGRVGEVHPRGAASRCTSASCPRRRAWRRACSIRSAPHPQSEAQALLAAVAPGRQRGARRVRRHPRPRRAPSRRRCTRSTRDVGRLAVTTPAYNTAITAITQGAYPYGGIDLARLYDDRQEVAATLGARPPASFGLLVRDRRGNAAPRDRAPGQRPHDAAAAAARAGAARRRQRRHAAAPVRRPRSGCCA